jgi:hypothetical protein
MKTRNGGPSHLRLVAAAVLAAVMILSALHAVAPHHRTQGPCVGCQTLSAQALVPAPAVSGLALEPRPLLAAGRGDEPIESPAPPLRPLRAPPLPTAL